MLRRNVHNEEMKCIDCTKKIQSAQMLLMKSFVMRRDATVPRMTLRERDPCECGTDTATRVGAIQCERVKIVPAHWHRTGLQICVADFVAMQQS